MHIFDTTIGSGDASHSFLIASCGYERRSSYVCRLGISGAMMIALEYGDVGGSHTENKETFEQSGWQVLTENSWPHAFESLSRACANGERVLVDLSSMPRAVLAKIVETIATAGGGPEVTFVYAPGDFEQSFAAATRAEVLAAEPMSSYFAGELRPTSVPIGLVVGLGLEAHRALGVMELLEPAQTWIFSTYSADSRFRAAAESVHRRLLDAFDPSSVFEYDIRSIADTYAALESLVFSAGLRYRLILAPSGPKVFTLVCLLVAAERNAARPAVWRVGDARPPRALDVREAGDLVAGRVVFRPS